MVEHAASFFNHAWIVLLAMQMGLAASFGDIAASFKKRALLGRILAANCLLIPLIAYGLLRLLDAHPYVSAGFLTLILFPGAIFGPALTALAKGDAPLSVGLMILFSCVSLAVSPFLLNFLLGAMLPGANANLEVARVARLIFLAQILPLSLGLAAQRLRPQLARGGRLRASSGSPASSGFASASWFWRPGLKRSKSSA